jgi:cellulose synthase/poly-beta-1,6-N-acetylglucosamine synthase-like glycosyltransferase
LQQGLYLFQIRFNIRINITKLYNIYKRHEIYLHKKIGPYKGIETMTKVIRPQKLRYMLFYIAFASIGLVLMIYYLSNTIIHFTTPQQFPINSFSRFPLTFLIFPAEIFSFIFSLYFVYNLINGNYSGNDSKNLKPEPLKDKESTRVAILLPVYNEPYDIVERTLKSCQNLRWKGGTKIYLLDDSTNEANIKNMEKLSKKYDAMLVRRKERTGYKAGNINNALSNHVKEKYFCVFDADQAPEPEFLEETMDHFSNSNIGFVQTPQYFVNDSSPLERAQKMGTNIFYQAQCQSKAKDFAMPFCGTNAVVRTEAFKQVNGFSYYTSTEDIELGLRMNEFGYHGAYVPKVLVKGYSPTHFSAYASQQYRWANGNLAILRESWKNILFGKFSMRQQIHTLFTTGWWFIGFVSFLYILVPILSFFFGGTHHTWLPTWMLAILFLNVALGISMIYMSLSERDEDDKITLKDAFLQYSLITNSMFIYAKAALSAIFKRYIGFVTTNKSNKNSNLKEIRLNLILAAICFCFSIFGLYKTMTTANADQIRTYLPISLWMLFYTIILGSSIFFVGNESNPNNESISRNEPISNDGIRTKEDIKSARAA